MTFGPLVEAGWLESELDSPDLRIFDTTVVLRRAPEGSPRPYTIDSGRAGYEKGHLPGAGFLDLTRELSDSESRFGFTLPPNDKLVAALARRGVVDACRVVLYSSGSIMWATRVWWMLRALGIENAAVLDGGWELWPQQERPISTEECTYAAGELSVSPQPGLWASKEEVASSVGSGSVCTLNALSPEVYDGSASMDYGRPGHIPGSHNVFYSDLLDPETRAFLDEASLRDRYRLSGALEASRAINYCGGGISATMGALALVLLGHPDVAVYDGSMSEWAADPELSLVTGPAPG